MNKDVSTGAVIRAKPGTEPDVHKLLANYQTAGTHIQVLPGKVYERTRTQFTQA